MAYTGINKHTDYFNTKLYTGNGSARSITGVGFRPDWLWIKQRSGNENHQVFDAVRTAGKQLETNTTSAESSTSLQSAFDSDGFSINNAAEVNGNGATYVSWNWRAGGGQGSSNTDGSINTTYTSVNATAGFSICKWAGSGANATIGHGLNAVPKMIITKSLASSSWCVYHAGLGNTKTIFLESPGSGNTHIAYYNNTSPTSSVFSVGTDDAVNHSGNDMIAYCFAEKTGFSKFGYYTGNGNSDGTFAFCGFKPAFVLFKRASGSNGDWQLWDNKRDTYNPVEKAIHPNANGGASADQDIDFLSNGFKIRSDQGHLNASGTDFIFMAFGQSLVGSNNIPCTAR